MDFLQAMTWAEDNKDIAKKWFNRYGSYTPYGLDDFQQVVLEAALVASSALGRKPLSAYESIFVRSLQVGMATLIPGYGYSEGQDGGAGPNVSMSIPSSRCVSYEDKCFFTDIPDEDTELSFFDTLCDKDEFVNPAFNAEHAYLLVQDHLDDRQKTVLTYTLGLTEKGIMSAREIEKETNISKSTVSRDLAKIFTLVSDLVSKNVISVFSPLPAPSSLEFDLRGTAEDSKVSCPSMFASDYKERILTDTLFGSSFWSFFEITMASDDYVQAAEDNRPVFELSLAIINAMVMKLKDGTFCEYLFGYLFDDVLGQQSADNYSTGTVIEGAG